MKVFTTARPPLLIAGILFSLGIAACGGGSTGTLPPAGGGTPTPRATSTATPTIAPTPSPVPLATFAPFTNTQRVAVASPTPAPAGQTPAPIQLAPPPGPVNVGISLPVGAGSSIPPGTAAQEVVTNQSPAGLPSLVSAVRAANLHAALSTGPTSVLVYLQLMFSAGVTLSNQPGITLGVPAGFVLPAGANYYVALYDPLRPQLGWQASFEGPGIVSGQTVTFNGSGGAFAFAAFEPYWFALYATSAAAPTPTPAPIITPNPTPTLSPTPVPTPTPTVSPGATPVPGFAVTPTTVAFTALGQTGQLTATDGAYFGTFGATSASPNVATISPASGSIGGFTVTAVGAGTAQLTISESNGRSATVTVTVTTTTIPIQ